MRASHRILGVRVDATNYPDATRQIVRWSQGAGSRYVCCATVNNVIEARDSGSYAEVMEHAALVTADGMPLVWTLRALGLRWASRVYGPDLTRWVLAAAERERIPIAFVGGTPISLSLLLENVRRSFPGIEIAHAVSPPFRPVTEEEDLHATGAIVASGARIVFVGLGSPKQDRWMHAHWNRIPGVMLGVGAAFDFLAGTKPQAPRWMQGAGLEWLFRLVTEPRRLWRRYLRQNPRFAMLTLAQILRSTLFRASTPPSTPAS